MDLTGKNILIAGGAKNLGGLTSRELAKKGANIAIHYNSAASKSDAEKTLSDIEKLGAKGIIIQGDLTKADNVTKLFDEAAKLGKLYGAVNTAGKVLRKPILEISEEEYDSMLDINAKAAFFFIKEAGKHLEDNGKLITIVTSLLAAYTGNYSVYAGGKSPVEHFTRAASKEFAPRMISVNSIAPGPMDTPFFYGQETAETEAYHKSQVMGDRLTRIEEIVPIIEFLLADGSWITGQTIFANGGYTTR